MALPGIPLHIWRWGVLVRDVKKMHFYYLHFEMLHTVAPAIGFPCFAPMLMFIMTSRIQNQQHPRNQAYMPC